MKCTHRLRIFDRVGEQCGLSIRKVQMYEDIESRCETVVDEFQQWFEHDCVFPRRNCGRADRNRHA